ncbi:glutamine--tRNA ligase [Ahniella affigens]|uniref:Glutamine--tRNA ligase n=1 Tax=Ahniella affigens TaxID=2021234 RepID=A0A2P1PVF2_9GAMM|nr:glutamine--tRNA ligase/YqeY domain fusion protein [Ahniella affigens]AVP98836.1 glutamine--tRNA ligase [Ahniella affigens]
MSSDTPVPNHFIRQIVIDDLEAGKHAVIQTRFPPEPNGYLHLGHAKSICLNFGLAQEFNGRCNLRFDDTNPAKEEQEYVDAIKEDVEWLGYHWAELRHASDYFELFYRCAVRLIQDGKAFVCDLNAEEVRAYRGTLTEPGKPSPYRDRSVAENLDLFNRMKAGEFDDGSRTLRAKIDMSSGNINLRDPALYRIRKVSHQNTGDAWCIYPMYDYAHALSDAFEGITHSLCTLEFEDHRPLYDWCLDSLPVWNMPELADELARLQLKPGRSRQIEFSRLNLDFLVMSKRKLLALVNDGLVSGWDDARMPTLRGIRRRGYTPEALRNFVRNAGVTKQESVLEYSLLENEVRNDLDARAERRMAVIDPLKLVITNLPADHQETLTLSNHPKDETKGQRQVGFASTVYIEREDFMEVPPKGFHRLVPGGEVRLRSVGIIKCEELIKDAEGQVIELRCSLDLTSRPGGPGADRKIKGTIHWVSAVHAIQAEVRLYDRLFTVADPDDDRDGKTYRDYLNPDSVRVVTAYLEASLQDIAPESRYQFERLGYFVTDRLDHQPGKPVFNRICTLRDSYAKAK